MFDISVLKEMKLTELQDIAKSLGIRRLKIVHSGLSLEDLFLELTKDA